MPRLSCAGGDILYVFEYKEVISHQKSYKEQIINGYQTRELEHIACLEFRETKILHRYTRADLESDPQNNVSGVALYVGRTGHTEETTKINDKWVYLGHRALLLENDGTQLNLLSFRQGTNITANITSYHKEFDTKAELMIYMLTRRK